MKKEIASTGSSFTLQDGTIINISKEDVKAIADKLVVEMIVSDQTKVFVTDDNARKRAQLLYDVYKNNSKEMSPEVKADYLNNILYLITEEEIDLISLEEYKKEKPVNP